MNLHQTCSWPQGGWLRCLSSPFHLPSSLRSRSGGTAVTPLLPSERTEGERQRDLHEDPTAWLFSSAAEMVGALEPPTPALPWASGCFAGQAGCQPRVVMQGMHRGWRLRTENAGPKVRVSLFLTSPPSILRPSACQFRPGLKDVCTYKYLAAVSTCNVPSSPSLLLIQITV